MTPSYSVFNPVLKCYGSTFNPFGAPTSGDAAAAKKVLQDAGKTLPVPMVYRKTATRDAAFAALKQSWDQAGFDVTLEDITDKYYRTIAGVAQKSTDASWASWGADWPSGSTVLPPLFDGRINLTESSSNQDYGWYNSDAVNQAIDAAYLIEDTDARERRGGRSTSRSARTAPSFRWSVRISPTCAVPALRAIRENQLFGGFPDLATIAVR